MEKQKLIFKLLKEGAITEDEAVVLMGTQKEYIPYTPAYPATTPWISPPYYITVGTTSGYSFVEGTDLGEFKVTSN